jgi:hypothetical protein
MKNKQLLFSLRVYKNLHPLFRFRKLSTDMMDFVKNNVSSGTTLAVDSFPLLLKQQIQIDKVIELSEFRSVWAKLKTTDVEFVSSFNKIVDDQQYNNVLLLGLTAFKYKSIQQCVDVINRFLPLLKDNGNILVALPITCLIFHRLKYSYDQIVDEMDTILRMNGLAIDEKLLDIDIFYVRITRL